MRHLKFLSILFAIGLLTSTAYATNYPSIEQYELKGPKGGRSGQPTITLKLVRWGNGGPNTASLASGDVVVYDTNSDDGVTVDTTASSHDARVAGVLVTTIQTADINSTSAFDDEGHRNYGYVIVHGPAWADAGGDNGATVGQAWITSKDTTKLTTWESTVTAGEVAQAVIGGFFMDTATDSSTQQVFVELE